MERHSAHLIRFMPISAPTAATLLTLERLSLFLDERRQRPANKRPALCRKRAVAVVAVDLGRAVLADFAFILLFWKQLAWLLRRHGKELMAAAALGATCAAAMLAMGFFGVIDPTGAPAEEESRSPDRRHGCARLCHYARAMAHGCGACPSRKLKIIDPNENMRERETQRPKELAFYQRLKWH
jgi:hypothetical protein